ncbi:hypothetical protein MNBD_GAMMA09-3433 [hydrothermal vent metagenome]|uniref:YfaZ n=1 Tax=hydrothermal vent metagenome TaxID=652676 RepID=A0A3B0XN42_9ZZZZ
MLKKLTIAIALLTINSQASARGIDFKLAEEMVELTYLTESSTFGYGGADVGFGAFFNENDDYQFNAEAMILGNPSGNNKALQLGIGGKIMYTSFDKINDEAGALAIAGKIRYVIPSSTPVAFLVAFYYAPGITSFSNAESFREYRLAVEVEITPSARAYLGYRNMEYEFAGNFKYELDDSAHVGVKFDF